MSNKEYPDLIRCRFRMPFDECGRDYRPIKFPPPHPYWCSGEGEDYFILIAYADNKEQIFEYWPEAVVIDSEESSDYLFTSRFPKPEWFKR